MYDQTTHIPFPQTGNNKKIIYIKKLEKEDGLGIYKINSSKKSSAISPGQ